MGIGDEEGGEEDEEGTDALEAPVLELLCRTAHIASSKLPCLECMYCNEQLLAERNVAKAEHLFSCPECQTVLTKQVKEAVSTQYVCLNVKCGHNLCFFVDCTCK
jgi:hypothetical protein